MYRTDFWTLWEKARVGCFKRSFFKLKKERLSMEAQCFLAFRMDGLFGLRHTVNFSAYSEKNSRFKLPSIEFA